MCLITFVSCNKDENGSNNAITDIDGNVYHTVIIGTQVWMVENLRTTKYNDGYDITFAFDETAWEANTSGAYTWYNNNIDPNKDSYGALYNLFAVNTGKLAPKGWHVSTDQDWTILIDFLGGDSIARDKLREVGTAHWKSPNEDATNETGFTALPGGDRCIINVCKVNFEGIGDIGSWWSPEDNNEVYTFERTISSNYPKVFRDKVNYYMGFSVRCVKD
jgi:uncharacterized protein (TIGR02145 family)